MKFPATLLLALLLASSRAEAQQTDERARGAARALAEDGVTALQSGDTNGAIDKLERAYQIVRLPTVGLWSARALAKAGRLVSAAERYVDVTRWSGASDARQAQAQADAARERADLLPRIGTLTLLVEGAQASDVTVTLDGEPVLGALVGASQPVDPKHHVAKATRGADTAEQAFDIAEGQRLSVSLKFGAPSAVAPVAPVASPQPEAAAAPVVAPAAAPPATGGDEGTNKTPSFWNGQRIASVAVGGAGLVSAIVSGVFTGSALSKKSDSKAYCAGSACTDPRGVKDLSDARSAGNIATITGIAGIGLIGAGVVLFLTAPSTSGPSVAVSPGYVTGGGSLLATGSF